MSFKAHRLRRGELLAGFSAVLLVVLMFALKWYGPSASSAARSEPSASLSGWNALAHLRWLMLATALAALALVILQATRRAPALPSSMSVIVATLGMLSVLALLYRVLINLPGNHLSQRTGAVLGLLSAIGIAYGGYLSLRQEGIAAQDGPVQIERVPIGHGPSSKPS